VRINAQLIDGRTGEHVWAERFDGPWIDVLKLQDKVLKAVATALELRLVWTGTDTSDGGTVNAEAYDEFLKASELESRQTPEDLATAVTHLKRALVLDSEYGEAHALLAWIYKQSFGNEPIAKALGLNE
jgi:hypothetical protein